MQHVDFMHLLRLSEQACESDARAYRRSVWWFALLGYAVVVLFGLGALAALAGVALAWQQRGFAGWMAWAGAAAAALGVVCVRAVVTRFDPPDGCRIEPAESPELFKALERIRHKVKGPRIDVVLVDAEFNAAILQRPRWGLFGHTNYLVIGWPMLCALEPRRLLAVVAHEYGHLRGEHGKFSAWVYRTRTAWWRMYNAYQDDESPLSWLFRRFFSWYIPRFNARTFALARQDEYEADRIAAALCGAEVVAQAWSEIEIKSSWYAEAYWRRLWRRALKEAVPEPMPHAGMGEGLLEPPPEDFACEALRQAMQRLPGYDDTHPVPRDRLAALGLKPAMPAWSPQGSLELLGRAARRVAQHFDAQWWQEMRRDWGRHREHLQQCRARIAELKPRAASLTAEEWLEWAECFEALSEADSTPFYEQALQRDPQHGGALRALAERRSRQLHPETPELLERLQAQHPEHGWAACSIALDWLDRLQHGGCEVAPKTRRGWRERLEAFEALEARAWQEFTSTHPCQGAVPPQLGREERKQLTGELIRTPEVQAAWLGGKQVAALPGRAYFVLFVRLKRPDEALGSDLVRRLMQQLPYTGQLLVTVVDLYVSESDMKAAGAQPVYQRRQR
ncbi:M48 family metallopeptidase [Aquabacterium sp. A7-Y]|uniref:M48 family metallopeptidase n=1 Tax=Aquabacterium sp. A7-Y TaxID=1349605 RepID=UPI00223D3CDD|nr:M48 family metallopeptidase [Aquabacterium sp. A7-Y]MCW7539904.1 M48 family metallopeptidase [Aquabacterium sp. A7-Y]